MHRNRQSIWTVLFALLFLRLVIGLHFFSEGLTKIQSGFSCANFLKQAKGPLADHFHSLVDDYDGHFRLCINQQKEIDPRMTFAVWSDFVESAKESRDFSEEQRVEADRALDRAKTYLSNFLETNRVELLAWVEAETSLSGFQRDADNRYQAANQVDSLYDQVQTISTDRNKTASPWLKEVEQTWDDLEQRINQVDGTSTLGPSALALNRPFAEADSPQAIIDRFLPWFDVTVGFLLVIGLFSRLAAAAGIGLLIGVVATQPFWVAGVTNTYYQWIEIASLLVLIATAAGRFGGLDYFLSRRSSHSEIEA